MSEKNIHDYTDILQLPHPISSKHPQMSCVNRAAQFAPFAALTGHKEAICESARLTDQKVVLDEQQKMQLNECLQDILLHIKEHPHVKVTYFVEDIQKEGGSYQTITNIVKNIDELYHRLVFMDKTSISIEDMLAIERL